MKNELLDKQIALETQIAEDSVTLFEKMLKVKSSLWSKGMKSFLLDSEGALETAFKSGRPRYKKQYPYVKYIGARNIVSIIAHTVFAEVMKSEKMYVPIISVNYSIAKEIRLFVAKKVTKEKYENLENLKGYEITEMAEHSGLDMSKRETYNFSKRILSLLLKTSDILLSFKIINMAMITLSEEAFEDINSQHFPRKGGIVKNHPMHCPPTKWEHEDEPSGYLLLDKPLVSRKHDGDTKLGPCKHLDALNKIQNVALKVSLPVLDVMKNSHKSGNVIGIETNIALPTKGASAEEKRMLFAENRIRKNRLFTMHATIKDAKLFSGNFYSPWFFDWRGRAYPYTWHLSTQGNDFRRGAVILPSSPRKFSDEAYLWQIKYLANMYGMSRSSDEDKTNWFNNNIELLEDSADNPESGQRFWHESDEPYTTLALLRDIFLDECSAPIRLDGTCNAMQWVAIMMRDSKLADASNLSPKKVPRDIYMEFAEDVMVELKEYSTYVHCEDKTYADYWIEHLRVSANSDEWKDFSKVRKTFKSAIMPIPYGISSYGIMRAWVTGGLMDNFPKGHGWLKPGIWFAKIILECAKSKYPALFKFLDYFRKCTELMGESSACKWNTLTGFTVDHDYQKKMGRSANTRFGKDYFDETYGEDLNKASRAMAANFIHSIDATHMAMIVNKCDFPVVPTHDCFACDPYNATQMRTNILETMYELSKNYSMEIWKENIESSGSFALTDPPIGDGLFILEDIKKSEVAFI